MKGDLRRIAAAAAALLLVALVASGCGGDNGDGSFNQRIGVLLPMTGQRDALGEAGEVATDLAQAQVDAAIRKVGADHSVKLLREDEGSDSSAATESATKLKREKATCVVGPYASSNAVVVANQVTIPADVPIISPAASADVISGVRDADLINRTVLPDRSQAASLAALMDRDLKGGAKGKSVSVGAYDSIYGTNLLKSFVDSWRKLGGRIAASISWKERSDYAPEVKKLTAKRPDAYVFFDSPATLLRLLGQLSATPGFSPRKVWASDGLADPSLTANPLVFGLRGVAPGAADDTPAGRAFDRLFKKEAKLKTKRQSFDAQAFDAYILCYLGAVAAGSSNGGKLADRLREVSGPPGKKYTWQQLPQAVQALRNGEEIDYEGASGPIDLDRNGDPTAGTYDAYRIDKERITITGQVPYPPEL